MFREREHGRREPLDEVGVELAPVLGEVKRAPAAGDLGQIRGVGMRKASGGEDESGVEEVSALWV